MAFVTALKDSKSFERRTVPEIYHHLSRTSDPSVWKIAFSYEIFAAFHILGKALGHRLCAGPAILFYIFSYDSISALSCSDIDRIVFIKVIAV